MANDEIDRSQYLFGGHTARRRHAHRGQQRRPRLGRADRRGESDRTTLDNTAAATNLVNAIVLNPSANLIAAGSNPLTLAGMISGDGALTKNGASTLILTADNSYAGGTTINSGTLQVGNGGATGSLGTGPVLDDAALVFNRSGIVTVPGAIAGTGSLTQMGVSGGTLVLTGANSYSGGTTIASGILQLGNGGTTGSIVGDVTDNGTFAFNRSDTVTFPGVISGSGGLSQLGSGTTILTGDNPYTGGTTVSGGALVVGDFAHPSAALSGGGDIAVESGGTFGGYGSVTGAVTNSGVIAAGNATPGFSARRPGLSPSLAICSIKAPSSSLPERASAICWRFAATTSAPAARWPSTHSSEATVRLPTDWSSAAAPPRPATHRARDQCRWPGAETTGNGIQVVKAINGATTSPGAFTLRDPELRAGAFDYDLFRGGV